MNEHGRPIGEGHHNAKLLDWEVEVLLELRDEGWGYKRLAKHFDVSTRSVRAYCSGKNRCQIPVDFRPPVRVTR